MKHCERLLKTCGRNSKFPNSVQNRARVKCAEICATKLTNSERARYSTHRMKSHRNLLSCRSTAAASLFWYGEAKDSTSNIQTHSQYFYFANHLNIRPGKALSGPNKAASLKLQHVPLPRHTPTFKT